MFVYELSGCGFDSSCSHIKGHDFINKKDVNVRDVKEQNIVTKVLKSVSTNCLLLAQYQDKH